ncbi:uncharacterized protein BDR25DRAFT_305868 [Lindgomyces ingoldianus]|uniref:Uncharacterized protein n=1 Tax=Lindgomyces ingoldianus TaxID=673940 RepID=A0ACB6QJL9_9PLEO|nr:uncharacterized protein BDR25DRAFT_305868 [Lindgomyces ingoldianus]KAF2467081.1 hypothetical protein BDR25DRAFT_305868 [Lindgomyces ingoldianus]
MFTLRLLRRPARQFLSRPLSTSPASIVLPRARAFHASTSRKSESDTLLYLPHEMLQALHLGLPWYAVLPVAAFIVRALLVTTMGSRARAIQGRYLGLQPVRHAIALQTQAEIMNKGGFRSPKDARIAVVRAVKRESGELDIRWNCRLRGQLGWSLAQFPIFIFMQETIRKMTGMPEGLFGLAKRTVQFEGDSSTLVGGATEAAPVHLQSSEWFEPSLTTEGILWFPDLIAPDPTGALPYIVSALMFATVYRSNSAPDSYGKIPRTTRVVRALLMGIALLIGPLLQNFPAAMMYYWACSTSSALLWNYWLDRKYPSVQGYGKCRRPLLMMPPPPKTRRM